MKKKLVKYAPVVYALWTNPETRARMISVLESVNGRVQQVAERRAHPAVANLMQDSAGNSSNASKVDSLVQRVPSPIFATLAKGANTLTDLLVKQDAKARASVK